jgi:hypothetical protein
MDNTVDSVAMFLTVVICIIIIREIKNMGKGK